MKIKWGKKKITLMIVPDANQSVMRFRISEPILILIPIILIAMVSTSFILYIIHVNNVGMTDTLKQQLKGKEEQFNSTVSEKNESIEQLQNQVVGLSEYAKEIEVKMEELKKFKEEMEALTGADLEDKKSESTVEISSIDDKGVGGEDRSVTDEDFYDLAQDVESNFSSLDEEMRQLITGLADTKLKLEERHHLLSITPTIWPTDARRITSEYGIRKDPFTFRRSFHSGIDMSGDTGDPVYATADGVIVDASYDSRRGNNITINHTQGIKTIYMHLSKLLVKKGDSVKKGQKIGLLGSTGRSTGPHLHYEVLKNGNTVNPKPYIRSSRKED